MKEEENNNNNKKKKKKKKKDTAVERLQYSFGVPDIRTFHTRLLAIVYGLLLEFSLVRTHIYQNICVVKNLWYCIRPGVSCRTEKNLFFL